MSAFLRLVFRSLTEDQDIREMFPEGDGVGGVGRLMFFLQVKYMLAQLLSGFC